MLFVLNKILSRDKQDNMVKITNAEKERAKAEKLAEKERAKAEKLAEKERAKAEKLAEKERVKAEKLAEKERAKAENLSSDILKTGIRGDNDRNNKQREQYIIDTLNKRNIIDDYTDVQKSLIKAVGSVIDITKLKRVELAGGRSKSYDFQFTMEDDMVYNVEFKSNGKLKLTGNLIDTIKNTPWKSSVQLCDIAFSNSTFWDGETSDGVYLKEWYDNGLKKMMTLIGIGDVTIPSYKEYIKYANSALTSNNVSGFFKILKEAMDLHKQEVTKFVSTFTNDFLLKHRDIRENKLEDMFNKKIGNKDFWLIWFDKSSEFVCIDTRNWNIEVSDVRLKRRNPEDKATKIGVYMVNVIVKKPSGENQNSSFILYPRWKNHNGLANPAWSVRFTN
ncbi:hypothetical protein BST79_gp125 [Only Syngen Nebraska virus 5]|uniref:hypothetical protein n=1 Tax=Only Syngen Nebraska virus 5 TaxID=1917232 RepID=UPI000901C484|nr:hypothetical protein BST79_gp125 [Only Syngen Nebraska virus 5]APC25638.1 hypothetical protein [Only Syngen Nebraska virus 5]